MPPVSSAISETRSLPRLTLFYAFAAALVVSVWLIGTGEKKSVVSANAADELDLRLQKVAVTALGDRRGSVIVIDPQTGRLRAVVNSTLAYEQSFRPGSTIKPFTTLVALRSGLVTEESHTLCHEKYSHDTFHTVCSHPLGLRPLNPTEAIAYSCNYFFGTLGERVPEQDFNATLTQFGFGQRPGGGAGAGAGKLLRNAWKAENAMGEGDNLEVTPLQLINAYSALLNGGRLFVPHAGSARTFVPQVSSQITIEDTHRTMILKGMRGAVVYGTAEPARLHSLPINVVGKTGTSSEIKGFRTQGWFVGFASRHSDAEKNATTPPEKFELGVLVFLPRAHGFDASEVARPIFDEFARSTLSENVPTASAATGESGLRNQSSLIRVHQVRENFTRELSLEDYIRGVVAAEGSTEKELEALKALAIASRTYALRNRGRHASEGYDFCSTTHCQRFINVQNVSRLTDEAVKSTGGEVLRDNRNEIVDSYFSASCGGATANMQTLWGQAAPAYLRGVEDESCLTDPGHRWSDVISATELTKALQSDPRTHVKRVNSLAVNRWDESGRAESLTIGGDRSVTISGWEFKLIVGRALGWNILKSSRFRVTRSGNNFAFQGSGFGHGLGLCQQGAHIMARRGLGYREILAKYFPTTHVSRDSVVSLDLMWGVDSRSSVSRALVNLRSGPRQTLSSENFRLNYPRSLSSQDAAQLLGLLQSSRHSLLSRLTAAGVAARLPAIEIFVNETTGDFVGRTGQPAWAAAATKGNRIDLQPVGTLKRRQVLETTLRHELVHIIVDSLGGGRTPRWIAEGLAVHYAGEGRLVSAHAPRSKWTVTEIEQKLNGALSAGEMRSAYAAAYSEVKRLIEKEGEAGVWRRVTNSGS